MMTELEALRKEVFLLRKGIDNVLIRLDTEDLNDLFVINELRNKLAYLLTMKEVKRL